MSSAVLLQRDWTGAHSALDPAGAQSARAEGLWHFLWIVALLVFLAVVVAFLWATFRRRDTAPPADPSLVRGAGRRAYVLIGAATGLSLAIIFVFLGVDLAAGRSLTVPPPSPLLIEVTAKQWWWQVVPRRSPFAPRQHRQRDPCAGWPAGRGGAQVR